MHRKCVNTYLNRPPSYWPFVLPYPTPHNLKYKVLRIRSAVSTGGGPPYEKKPCTTTPFIQKENPLSITYLLTPCASLINNWFSHAMITKPTLTQQQRHTTTKKEGWEFFFPRKRVKPHKWFDLFVVREKKIEQTKIRKTDKKKENQKTKKNGFSWTFIFGQCVG